MLDLKRSNNKIQKPSFEIEVKDSRERTYHKYEMFFKDSDENLLGYIKFQIVDNDFSDTIRIIDITTSSGYNHLPESLKKLYDDNGYNEKVSIKGSAKYFVENAIDYIRQNFPNKKILLVACSYKGLEKLEIVLKEVSKMVRGIVFGGGGDISPFMLKI